MERSLKESALSRALGRRQRVQLRPVPRDQGPREILPPFEFDRESEQALDHGPVAEGRHHHGERCHAVEMRRAHADEGRDTRGEGSVTVVEIFDTDTGQAVIARKDEDLNGDGEIDVVSIYQAGRLVRREISDPSFIEDAG